MRTHEDPVRRHGNGEDSEVLMGVSAGPSPRKKSDLICSNQDFDVPLGFVQDRPLDMREDLVSKV